MNIRLFFSQYANKQNQEKQLTDAEIKEKNEVKHQGQKFINLMGRFVSNQVIDMLEYSHMMEFYKLKGNIVLMARYMQIVNKIRESDKLDEDQVYEFDEAVNCIFGHLHNVVKDNGKINVSGENGLVKSIQAHNQNLIKFTKDQRIGIKKICSFLYDSNTYNFSLRGFAGTGKTTLITKLVHYLILKNYIKSVVFAAPTNKAVNVMKSKFRNDMISLIREKVDKDYGKGNGDDDEDGDDDVSFDEQLDILDDSGFKINFLTIHKLLNYKNDFDHNGKRIFVKGTESLIDKFDLVIVDECSMIPMQIIIDLFEELRKKKNNKLKGDVIRKIPKVLFVGDPAQLPPVNEKVSIIFAEKDKEFDYKQFCEFASNDDNYFDLAIVDPPYGIDVANMNMGAGKSKRCSKIKEFYIRKLVIYTSVYQCR